MINLYKYLIKIAYYFINNKIIFRIRNINKSRLNYIVKDVFIIIANVINFILFIRKQFLIITKLEIHFYILIFIKFANFRVVKFLNIEIFIIRFKVNENVYYNSNNRKNVAMKDFI